MNTQMISNDYQTTSSLVLDAGNYESIVRVAELMAGGRATVPAHLQRNPADCLAVVMQAVQWGMNPFAVAQKTHLISGVLGYEAQLVNAVLIARAPITGRPNYEWFGPWEKIIGKFKEVRSQTKKDDTGEFKKYRVPDWSVADEEGLGIRVWATIKGETEPRELTLLMTQARTRNSTLWTDDPKQQLAYLALKRWARLYCPDVILGVYTQDELTDFQQPEIDVTPDSSPPKKQTQTASLKNRLGVGKKPEALPPPKLEDVIFDINDAFNKETLHAAKERMNQLQGADHGVALERYKERVAEIKAQGQPPKTDIVDVNVEALMAAIQNSTDLEVLHVNADLINEVADAEAKDRLQQAYHTRQAALESTKP